MMKLQRSDIEIMAPAGSYESLMAAIHAKANAVYFGAGALNMRNASSVNFTEKDIERIVGICKENGIKSYLTLNNTLHNSELNKMHAMMDTAKANGVSAVIVSDMAAIAYARSIDLPVHISTQLSISNYESLKFYAQFADVVVLAREVNIKQVRSIFNSIQKDELKGPGGELVRIEMFVHGALCMAISGKCYLSLHETRRSANKGSCIQDCRHSYLVVDKESGRELEIDNEYIMSAKDLKTISFIDDLIDSGVRILKIEGRARSPEYVKTVVECYNEAIEEYLNGTFDKKTSNKWDDRLSTVFNRGFWDGYYLGRKIGEWNNRYGSVATKRKEHLGKCTNYYSNIGVGEFVLESGELSKGDEMLVIGGTTGVVEMLANELHLDRKVSAVVKKGDRFTMKMPSPIRRHDKLYKVVSVNPS